VLELAVSDVASISILVYTRWRNLLKTASMEVGQVGFHDKTKVKRMKVEKDNSIVNRLNKTKEVSILKGCRFSFQVMHIIFKPFLFLQEKFPDLAALQEARAAEFRAAMKEEKRSKVAAEKQARREAEEAAKLRSFS
jgi:hypothetical protein